MLRRSCSLGPLVTYTEAAESGSPGGCLLNHRLLCITPDLLNQNLCGQRVGSKSLHLLISRGMVMHIHYFDCFFKSFIVV